jgi:hypothetical protein
MQECQLPREELLPGAVHLKLEGPRLDLLHAKEAATGLAHTYASDPELLSWYDGETRDFSPKDDCVEGKPGWVEYALSHGGNLTMDVNHEDYVFIFRGVTQFP